MLAGCSVQLTAREMGADDVTFYQAALPAFAGHNIHLNQGRETTALTTYHVEIAEKSSAAVPEVENVFRGMRAGLVPHLGPQGVGFLGAIDLYANSLPVRRASEGSQIGDLYLSDRRYTRFTWRDSTAGPGPHNLGEGPRIGINGVDRRTTMQVEIIPLAR